MAGGNNTYYNSLQEERGRKFQTELERIEQMNSKENDSADYFGKIMSKQNDGILASSQQEDIKKKGDMAAKAELQYRMIRGPIIAVIGTAAAVSVYFLLPFVGVAGTAAAVITAIFGGTFSPVLKAVVAPYAKKIATQRIETQKLLAEEGINNEDLQSKIDKARIPLNGYLTNNKDNRGITSFIKSDKQKGLGDLTLDSKEALDESIARREELSKLIDKQILNKVDNSSNGTRTTVKLDKPWVSTLSASSKSLGDISYTDMVLKNNAPTQDVAVVA